MDKFKETSRVYDIASLVASIVFAVLCVAIIIGNLIIQKRIVDTVNELYEVVETGYQKTQTVYEKTNTVLGGYKSDVQKLANSLEIIDRTGNGGRVQTEALNVLDNLEKRVLNASTFFEQVRDGVERTNQSISLANNLPRVSLPTVPTDGIDRSIQRLADANSNVSSLKTAVESASASEVNSRISEKISEKLGSNLETVTSTVSAANSEVTKRFDEVTASRNVTVWWVRFAAIIVTIFFTWATYTALELVREKYRKVRKNKGKSN